MGQLQFVKEDDPQLSGGVDVELLARHVVNGLLQLHDTLMQVDAELSQRAFVDAEARQLHLRQHPAQGQLHLVEQRRQVQLLQLAGQNLIQGGNGAGIAAQGGFLRGGVAEWGEGIPGQVGRGGQLRAAVGHKQPLEVVSSGGGVQQVGSQRCVEDKALGRQAALQQGVGHVLYVVGHLGDIGGEQAAQQSVPVAVEPVRAQDDRQAVVVVDLTFHRQRPKIVQSVYCHVGHAAPLGKEPRRVVIGLGHLDHDGIVLVMNRGGRFRRGSGRGQIVFLDKLGELQLHEQVVQLRPVGLAQSVLRVEFQRRVGNDGGQPIAAAGSLLALRQLPQGGGLGLHVRHGGIQRVDAAVALHQRRGGLFADARHAGNVVAAVAHQGLQVDHVNGVEAVLLPEQGGGHVGGGGLAHAGGHQLHAGTVGDELQAVPVAGDDDALPAPLFAAAGDGAQQVVGLVAHHFVAGDGHGAQHLLHHRHLLGKLLGHALASGLVIGVGLVAEGGLLPVKGHTQRLRLFLVHEALEHVQKAENGVGIQPVPCGQGLHAVKGAVDDAVAVKNHQFHGRPPCGVRFHRISYYSLFPGKTQPPVLTVFTFVIDWSMFTPI